MLINFYFWCKVTVTVQKGSNWFSSWVHRVYDAHGNINIVVPHTGHKWMMVLILEYLLLLQISSGCSWGIVLEFNGQKCIMKKSSNHMSMLQSSNGGMMKAIPRPLTMDEETAERRLNRGTTDIKWKQNICDGNKVNRVSPIMKWNSLFDAHL